MGNAPAFQLYASDFYMDTLTWDCDDVGAYFRLLMFEWVNGPLPNNERKLAKIALKTSQKFNKNWSKISQKFSENENGMLINLRLEETRKEQEERRKRIIESGRKGGLRTQEIQRETPSTASSTAKATLKGSLKPSSSSSSSSSNKKKPPISPKGYTADFESFWEAYPKKIGKGEAFKSWNKNGRPSLEIILSAIEKQKQSKQWKNDNGQYIPNPSTWLNQGRWDDEVMVIPKEPTTPKLKPVEHLEEISPEQVKANREFLRNLSNTIGKGRKNNEL